MWKVVWKEKRLFKFCVKDSRHVWMFIYLIIYLIFIYLFIYLFMYLLIYSITLFNVDYKTIVAMH